MSELTTIARPYAKAVFAHAAKAKTETQWREFLHKAATIASDAAMVEVLKNPAVLAETKCAMLADLTTDVDIDGSLSLLEALSHYGRFLALPSILSEFDALVAQGERALAIIITSSFRLEEDELQLLESKLKKKYKGKTIRIQTAVDQSLIGGFEIRSSDTVIDATVRGRLFKIAESLSA